MILDSAMIVQSIFWNYVHLLFLCPQNSEDTQMKLNCTNDEKRLSRSSSVSTKILSVFLWCFCHFYFGQIYPKNDTGTYQEEGVEIIQETEIDNNISKNIIYVSSETSISGLSDGNFAVVEIPEISKKTANVPVSKIKEKLPVKCRATPVKLARNQKEVVQVFHALPDSSSVISTRQDQHIATFIAQTIVAKHIFSWIDTNSNKSFSGLSKTKLSDYLTNYASEKTLSISSIRPPPAFL